MITTSVSHIVTPGNHLICWASTDEPGSRQRQVVIRMPDGFENAPRRQASWMIYEALIKRFPTGRIKFPDDRADSWQREFDESEMTTRELNELLDAHDAHPKAGRVAEHSGLIMTHSALRDPRREPLTIERMDAPGEGGDHHHYRVGGFVHSERDRDGGGECWWSLDIYFQNGPVPTYGQNGVTMEVLLAIVADRLRCLQQGPYACEPNAVAMVNTEAALEALKARTRERMARGVEGSMAS